MQICGPTPASAITFQIDITSSTYQVQAGDTYADLLLQHQAGSLLSSNTVTGIVGISAPVEAGVNTNYSMLVTTVLDIATAGTYEFQVGTDWGRGGASVIINNGTGAIVDEFVTTQNIWWNNDWNNPDVFSSVVTLSAGSSYTLGWVGFEDCCGGSATLRFSYNGGTFQDFTEVGIAPLVSIPEPAAGLLVALGLILLAGAGRNHLPA